MPSNSLLESKNLNNVKIEGIIKGNTKKPIVLSYIPSFLINFITHQKNENTTEIIFSSLIQLVEPYTDTKIDGYGSVKGVYFNNFFNEHYSVLYKNSNISFEALYANQAKRDTVTSDAKITFPVVSANGIFEGAKEVIIEYTSDEYESRIGTVYF